jgi:hypothetical protein
MAISIEHLLTLARAYSEATGLALTGVGQRACKNNRVFTRLAEGRGANVLTMDRAAQWFAANWPEAVPWPEGVPGGPRGTQPHRRRTGERNGTPSTAL